MKPDIRSYKHAHTKPFYAMRDTEENGYHEQFGNVYTPHGIVEITSYSHDMKSGWDTIAFEMILCGRKYFKSVAEKLSPRQISSHARQFAAECEGLSRYSQ